VYKKICYSGICGKYTCVGMFVCAHVVYLCKIWLLPQRDDYRWSMFENDVLGMCGSKRNEVTGGVEKL
jgi:hypothetical protein